MIGQRQLVLVSWLFLASFEGLAFVNITVSQHLVSIFISIFSGFTEFCQDHCRIVSSPIFYPPLGSFQNEVSIDLSSGIFAESDLSMTLG